MKLKTRNKVTGEISTASTADIAFLLLIFFLVSTMFDIEKGLMLDLPPSSDQTESKVLKLKNLTILDIDSKDASTFSIIKIKIRKDGSKIKQPISLEQVEYEAKDAVARNPDMVFIVRTKGTQSYGPMVKVLDKLKQGNATRIAIKLCFNQKGNMRRYV